MPVVGVSPMLNLEQILFATDFSDASETAQAYARALALRFGASIEVVHIFDPSSSLPEEDSVLAPFGKMRRKMRQRRLTSVELELRAAGIEVNSALCQGTSPGEELLGLVDRCRADLLVLGTHGKRGLERFMLGSTAEEVIRRSSRPVLTVGPNTKMPTDKRLSFNTIVYATDFSVESVNAAAFALSFAEDSGAQLYFCHVTDRVEELMAGKEFVDDTFRAELDRLVPPDSYDWCSPHCVVEHGKANEGILALARRIHADLIVLGPRKPTFVLTHLERGVTPRVLGTSECPVLTVI